MDKQAPSAEAVELAEKLNAQCNARKIMQYRENVWVWDDREAAKIINKALRAAELRGIKAGLEAAAQIFEEEIKLLEANGMSRENFWEINKAMSCIHRILAISPATVQCKGE